MTKEIPASDFRSAEPFPHCVVDDYFDVTTLGDALREIQRLPPTSNLWRWRKDKIGGTPGRGKGGIEDVRKVGKACDAVHDHFTGESFREELTRLSGIPNIVVPPDTCAGGAGIHCIPREGRLGAHVDFNQLGRCGDDSQSYFRRINAFLYLNRNWCDEWGGHLSLYDTRKQEISRYAPSFNRLIIFECSEHSWHGHPKPLRSPVPRYSFAFYYYTNYAPAWFVAKHSTIYDRDLGV